MRRVALPVDWCRRRSQRPEVTVPAASSLTSAPVPAPTPCSSPDAAGPCTPTTPTTPSPPGWWRTSACPAPSSSTIPTSPRWSGHALVLHQPGGEGVVGVVGMSGSVEFHHTDLTEVERFPAARIVYSTYTLGLLGPDALAEIWPKLVASLPRGGVMAVDMFGTNDTWADRPDIATLPVEEIDAMFRGFQIIDRSVRDEDGRFLADRKHWHVITTLARKLN